MTISTITVNQWRIKDNLLKEPADREPVICVNTYEDGDGSVGSFGELINGPVHVGEVDLAISSLKDMGFKDIKMHYSPDRKTPCGASCWLEISQ